MADRSDCINADMRLAALPRPAGEQHDMDPGHDLCVGDDRCICIQLMACEQRVRQSAATLWDRTSEQMAAARVEGFAAGLDAAREAIKNTRCPEGYEVKGCSHWDDALAAIDALREKP